MRSINPTAAASTLLVLLAITVYCPTTVRAQSAWRCTPIKPGCACETPATLSCSDLASMRADIVSAMDAFPAGQGATPLARFKGGIVRLAFHDASEYNATAADTFADGSPKYRMDGCVDMNHPGNAGLGPTIAALDALWAPKHCAKISRADFWFFAAKVVIEESTPYAQADSSIFRVGNFSIPFHTGRVDRVSCPTVAPTTSLPGAEGGAAEIQRTLMDNLGLDVQHTVALLGAHALGGTSAANSGYSGHWTLNPDLFTTQFFQGLLIWAFDATPMPKPGGGGEAGGSQTTLQQWNIDQSTSADVAATEGIIMLNTDMALMYDVDHDRDSQLPSTQRPKHCGLPMPDDEFHNSMKPGAPTPAPSQCPYLRFKNPALNFEYWVRWFADASGPDVDSPGADRFLPAFSRAFAYVSQMGYDRDAMRCMVCQNRATCPDAACATANVQCGLTNPYTPPASPCNPTTRKDRFGNKCNPSTTAAPPNGGGTPETTRTPPVATTKAPSSPADPWWNFCNPWTKKDLFGRPCEVGNNPTTAPPAAYCNPVTKKDGYGRKCTPSTPAPPTPNPVTAGYCNPYTKKDSYGRSCTPPTPSPPTTKAPTTKAPPATPKPPAYTPAPTTTKAPPATPKPPAYTPAPTTTKAPTTKAPAYTPAPTTKAPPATPKPPAYTPTPPTTRAPTPAPPVYTPKPPATTAAPCDTDGKNCNEQAGWEASGRYDPWLVTGGKGECPSDANCQRAAVTTPATKGCTRTKSDGDWTLVLAEEFNGADGSCVNTAVWGTEKGYVRNQELQYYTDAPANLFHRGGALVIKALNVSGNVTSASIYSKQAYTYGRFEARMKVPKGRGVWAAFWLLGIDIDTLGWPWCGEIALEYLGSSPNTAMGVIQSAEKNFARNNEPKGTVTMSYPNDFVVYTIDWTPTAVTVFADGMKIAQMLNDRHCRQLSWPFDRPFNVKLNLAIGGSLGGQQGVDPAIFPSELVVDYVRIYQRSKPSVCPVTCYVSRYYFVAESLDGDVSVDDVAAKLMTVPAKYREFEDLVRDAIVALAELDNETDVVFDAMVPFRPSGCRTRFFVNFTVREKSAAGVGHRFDQALRYIMKSPKALAAALKLYAWMKSNFGCTWQALDVGDDCNGCFTNKKAPLPFPFQVFQLPTTVPFASYDYGGESVAYHDLSAFNVFGDNYRSGPDYVDIPLENGKPVVGSLDVLDWMHFSGLKAPACPAGTTTNAVPMQVSVKAANGMMLDGIIELKFIPLTPQGDEVPCASASLCPVARITVPTTWAWIWYKDTAVVSVTLSCGVTYRMRATFPEPYYNIDSVTIAAAAY